jgi:nucleoside-diphosphate-sugar epimerase
LASDEEQCMSHKDPAMEVLMSDQLHSAPKEALILGAGGGFSRAAALSLRQKGWMVTGFGRRQPVGGSYDRIISGDAMDVQAVKEAAQGKQLIVHGLNPPYNLWRVAALAMLANTIAVAEEAGATLLFPGNIYNFGPDAGALLTENAPQNPLTRKGRIRKAMEDDLRRAADRGLRVIVLRCGDFFGPEVKNTWLEGVILGSQNGMPKAYTYSDDPKTGHSWAYLPDAGEAAGRLAELDLPSGFHAFGFEGHFLERGQMMLDAIDTAAGGGPRPIKAAPWLMWRFLSPFVPIVRELLEMRYLWQVPHRIDGSALATAIGPLPQTPLLTAVRATIASRLS